MIVVELFTPYPSLHPEIRSTFLPYPEPQVKAIEILPCNLVS